MAIYNLAIEPDDLLAQLFDEDAENRITNAPCNYRPADPPGIYYSAHARLVEE